jgi:Zn-dependent M28 family amino/carboxypeptidase
MYEGRKTGTKENKMAADYIIGRFKEVGLEPYDTSFKKEFKFTSKGKEYRGVNLIGYIAGKKRNAIVVSAHYDHIGITKELINNGADDNASGVGGLLAIADYFSKNKPDHTLIFLSPDAEEMGLRGAEAFISNPPVPLSQIKLNINMDMISHNDKGELYAAGSYHYPELKKFFTIENPKVKIIAGHDDPKLGQDDWTYQSDQGPFHSKKIPFIYFGVEDHPDYHKPTDEYQNINKSFYSSAVNAIIEVLKKIDKENNL